MKLEDKIKQSLKEVWNKEPKNGEKTQEKEKIWTTKIIAIDIETGEYVSYKKPEFTENYTIINTKTTYEKDSRKNNIKRITHECRREARQWKLWE